MKLLSSVPFFKIWIFLASGILMQDIIDLYILNSLFIIIIFIGFLSLLIIHYHLWYRKYSLRWIPGFSASVLIFLFAIFIAKESSPLTIDAEENIEGVGIIKKLELKHSNKVFITLQLKEIKQSTKLREKDKLLLIVDNSFDKLPQAGNIMILSTTVKPLPTQDNPHSFNYGKYLKNKGYSAQAYLEPEDISIIEAKQYNYMAITHKIKTRCIHSLKKGGISDRALALIQALLLGDKTEIDKETKQSFIKSGTIHLLAVSGLHIGILYIIMNSFLSLFLKPYNTISIIISFGFLFFYTAITGFSPSVSRAALMFSIIHFGRATQQQGNIYNSLAISASILLLINPLLIYNVGYWLSHIAVLGIVSFYPVINKIIYFKFIVARNLWSLISVSLAAQLTTLPISIYIFGAFSPWFLIGNIIMLPLMAPILLLSVGQLIFSFSPFISSIFAGGLNDAVIFMLDIAKTLENLPHSYIQDLWLCLPLVILSYIILYQIAVLFNNKKEKYLLKISATLLLLIAGLNIQLLQKLNNEQIIVYNTKKGLLIDVVIRGKLLSMKTQSIDKQTKEYVRSGLIKRVKTHNQKEKEIIFNDNNLNITKINMGSQRFMVISGNTNKNLNPSKKYNITTLILSSCENMNIEQLIETTNCKTIVAAANCPYKIKNKWGKIAKQHSICFHSIGEKGAYISKNKKLCFR